MICTDGEKTSQVISNTGVRYIPTTIKTDISPISDIGSIFKLTATFIKERPDVVHAHMSKAGFVSMISARLCGVPHRIYHNHGMAAFSSSGLKRLILSSVERITCRLATSVIFCGKSTLEEAVRQKFCASNKATLIGHGTISGIDPSRFRKLCTDASKAEIRKIYGLPQQCTTVGFVGRIVAHKGIDNIIRSWPLVQSKTNVPTQLVIAGDNDNNELFKRLSNFIDSYENVTYLGRIESISKIYQLLDMLILPSWHEGFPYSVLEAQCTGVPAIVSEVPGNIDAVVAGSTGLHIPIERPDLLAEAIIKLASNPDLRLKMSKEAENRVKSFYTQHLVLENLRIHYKKLLK